MNANDLHDGSPEFPAAQATAPSGIEGLDHIMFGGYPAGELTVIRGASGTGKTMIALAYASYGGTNSPCVFASFDEDPRNLASYFKTRYEKAGVHFLDMRPPPDAMPAGGEIELGGILIRIDNALKKSGARRLVLDAVDVLFASFGTGQQIRQDLSYLMAWCRESGVTVLASVGVTDDLQEGTSPFDYAAHSVINLRQTVSSGLMTRVLHVRKRRGGGHGTNEYPFLIDEDGVYLDPVTSLRLDAPASLDRLSTGITDLDRMLGGAGIWVGSALLISGSSGCGKSLLAATLAGKAAASGRKVLYTSFEEAPNVFVRDIASIGLDFVPLIDSGQLRLVAHRATECGIEEQLIKMSRDVAEFEPDIVIIDPISALSEITDLHSFKNAILRLITKKRASGRTVVMTELIPDHRAGTSALNLSSAVDTWIRLGNRDQNGEQIRTIHIAKSRGTSNSTQVREFIITSEGLRLEEPYYGSGAMVFGSAKQEQQQHELREDRRARLRLSRLKRLLTLATSLRDSDGDDNRTAVEREIITIETDIAETEAELEDMASARQTAQIRRGT